MKLAPSSAWLALALVACTTSSEIAPREATSDRSRALTTTTEHAASPPAPSVVKSAAAARAPTPEAAEDASPRPPTEAERARYTWLGADVRVRSLRAAVAPPPGFTRVAAPEGSFAAFLRELPLRPEHTPVRAYTKDVLREADDPRIEAVVELDVSPTDIQQCADSVIRLHAEWLWSAGKREAIGYHFLSGDFATWPHYRAGERPIVDGNRVRLQNGASPKDDRATFRKYLDMVFNYASTISLAGKSSRLVAKEELQAGDFFVLPGGPGHAILILDVASDDRGHKVALLGQGYMPAQDFQVLATSAGSPWFSLDGDEVDTPFWPVPFPFSSLHRMN